jgi:DNA-3-methyladenine glycosylase II
VLGAIIEEVGPLDHEARRRGRPDDSYGALLRSIVGQQLSVKAAATIYGRVTELYGGATPTPAQLIETDPEDLRAAGLSYSKAAYLRDLAERVEDGDIDLGALPELSDKEVGEMLIRVKGLGQWTVDMFLMFHLGRPDVLPVGDLGIRRAAERAYGLRKLPSPERLTRLARPWRPYRTLACLYLWESLDNAPA